MAEGRELRQVETLLLRGEDGVPFQGVPIHELHEPEGVFTLVARASDLEEGQNSDEFEVFILRTSFDGGETTHAPVEDHLFDSLMARFKAAMGVGDE